MKVQSQPEIEASLGLGMPKNSNNSFCLTVLMNMNLFLGCDWYSFTVYYCVASFFSSAASIHWALITQKPIAPETSRFHHKFCLITSSQRFQSNIIVEAPHFELFSLFQDETIAKFETLGGSHNCPWEMQITWVRLAKLSTVIVRTL